MLSMCLFLEDVVLRRDIGAGLGGNFGRYEGLLAGLGLGGLVASKIANISQDRLESGDPETILPVLSGMFLGAGTGMALGGQIGRHVGKNVISNPDAPADFSKAADRIGHLANPNTKWYGALSDIVLPGSASVVGSLRNAVSSDGVARLGYDNTGRLAQGLSGILGYGQLSPLMGFATPPNKVKNKK